MRVKTIIAASSQPALLFEKTVWSPDIVTHMQISRSEEISASFNQLEPNTDLHFKREKKIFIRDSQVSQSKRQHFF